MLQTTTKEKNYLLVIGFIFFFYTAISFAIYKERTLAGDINNHILSSEKFGVPSSLKLHGINPFYKGQVQTGWDGQFYYYMSNDLFGRSDIPPHIDSPSYRYQRIGLSLYAAALTKLAGRDWVSPSFFFYSYFILIFIATIVGALYLNKIGVFPYWILIWSISVGTQITLFNALPDAAADAFLILSIALFSSGKNKLSIIPLTMSVLCREVYIVFPVFLISFLIYQEITANYQNNEKYTKDVFRRILKLKKVYLLTLPILIWLCWYLYVVIHFGAKPTDQASGVLGFPLSSWYEFFSSGITGHHKVVGTGIFAYLEAFGLILFLGIILSTVFLVLKSKIFELCNIELKALALTATFFSFLYLCFGPTVMMHYSGYLKAIGPFFLVLPILVNLSKIQKCYKKYFNIFLILALVGTSFYNFKAKVLPYNSYDIFTNISKISNTDPIGCFTNFSAVVRVKKYEIIGSNSFFEIFGGGKLLVITLDLKNLSDRPFISSTNLGSVFMSYQWVDKDGKVVMDGIRSAIIGKIDPGQAQEIKIISKIPNSSALFKLSPVQEGCSWFYLKDQLTVLN